MPAAIVLCPLAALETKHLFFVISTTTALIQGTFTPYPDGVNSVLTVLPVSNPASTRKKGIQLLKHNSIKRIPRVQTGLYLFTFFEMKVSVQQPAYKMLPDRELASQPPYLLLAFSFPKLH